MKETVKRDDGEQLLSLEEFKEKNVGIFDIYDYNLLYDEYNKYFKEHVKVGDGVTVVYWTDQEAYTVIKKTPCTLTMRRCKATLSANFTPQNDQEYEYSEDPDGAVVVAHWSKKECRYKWNGLRVIPGRHEFYDYNY